MTKDVLRKEILTSRKNITERDEKNAQILKNFLSLPVYKSAKTIMTYISYNGEVDTKNIISHMLKDKKTLCAPKCVTECDIEARFFESLDELTSGAYGILEPNGNVAENIDLIIVPGVAFNERCHRIGYGAGYYDRFLKSNTAVSIGLFYEMQKADFEESPFDINLDYIITEKTIYKKEQSL